MTLIDVNLLLYAYDADNPRHAPARRWLAAELSSGRLTRFPDLEILNPIDAASGTRDSH